MMSKKARLCFERYLENLALAAELEEKLDGRQSGWICVVRFYAALHLVNAYLIDKRNVRLDPSSSDHSQRRAALARCPELRDAPDKYRRLKDLSESVRYDASFEFTAANQELSAAWLEKIATIVEPKLKRE
jgi:hypothetical protein